MGEEVADRDPRQGEAREEQTRIRHASNYAAGGRGVAQPRAVRRKLPGDMPVVSRNARERWL
jgi:hypothetical protein